MDRDIRRGVRLRLDTLENRDVPALVDFSQLAVDPSSYDATHILAKWTDGLAHGTRYTQTAATLGNGLCRLTLKANVTVAQAVKARQRVADDRARAAGLSHHDRADAERSVVRLALGPEQHRPDRRRRRRRHRRSGSLEHEHRQRSEPSSPSSTPASTTTTPDLAANIWRQLRTRSPATASTTTATASSTTSTATTSPTTTATRWTTTATARTWPAPSARSATTASAWPASNWTCQIMALKFLDANGSGYLSDAIRAINYAVANGRQGRQQQLGRRRLRHGDGDRDQQRPRQGHHLRRRRRQRRHQQRRQSRLSRPTTRATT